MAACRDDTPPTTARLEYIICVVFRACLLLIKMHYFLYYITIGGLLCMTICWHILTLKPKNQFSPAKWNLSIPWWPWHWLPFITSFVRKKHTDRNRLPAKTRWLFLHSWCVCLWVSKLSTQVYRRFTPHSSASWQNPSLSTHLSPSLNPHFHPLSSNSVLSLPLLKSTRSKK